MLHIYAPVKKMMTEVEELDLALEKVLMTINIA